MLLDVTVYMHPTHSSISGDRGLGEIAWGSCQHQVLISTYSDTAFILCGAHRVVESVV